MLKVCKLRYFLDSQLWKLEGKMLKNKAGFWKGKDEWNFRTKLNSDDLIYIQNIITFLGIKTNWILEAKNGEVMREVDKEENKAEQLWKKGEPDAEGYFTLQNSGEPKVLTAISESSLEIIGMR